MCISGQTGREQKSRSVLGGNVSPYTPIAVKSQSCPHSITRLNHKTVRKVTR